MQFSEGAKGISQLPSGTKPAVLRLLSFQGRHLSSPAIIMIKTMKVHIDLTACSF